MTSAIHQQVDRFLHTCAQVTPYEDYIALAEAMNRLTPGDFAKKTFFVNTGAEAVENAVKIARAYTKRPAIVCFEDAFHGRTLLGMALTSKTHPYKAGFEPFPSEIYRIPYAYCYRCSYGKTYPELPGPLRHRRPSTNSSAATSRKRPSPPSSSNPCSAKAASSFLRLSSSPDSAPPATNTASC